MKLCSWLICLVGAVLMTAPAPAQSAKLPYTLSFQQVAAPNLPALQSVCLADVSPTQWLILGGRTLGLHQFNPPPANNFALPNTILWSINPTTGTALKVADLSQLPPDIGDPLTATNQECEYNEDTGYWYVVGGYGMSRKTKTFVTFSTIFQIPVVPLMQIANRGNPPAQMQAAVAQLLEQPGMSITNPAMKVTGGVLSRNAAGMEFLSFGQIFDGSYNPFGSGFTQVYTNSVLPFVITSSPFSIRTLRPITSADPDEPFHRRDFAAAYDIDPTTKQDRFAVFGGVFKPGSIAGYDYPVYVTGTGLNISVTPDRTVKQHFGFYQAPVIVVWDGSKIYHTFFGGIGHYYYTQTAAQKTVYDYVTGNGRNDGLPFIEDIDTLIENGAGKYAEYIAPITVPGNQLQGASTEFIPNLAESAKFQGIQGNVVNLSVFKPGERALIGYIYGGVQADYPLPCQPSHGTQATNVLYRVYLQRTAWAGQIPATEAKEAVGYYTHGDAGVATHPEVRPQVTVAPPPECSSMVPPYPYGSRSKSSKHRKGGTE